MDRGARQGGLTLPSCRAKSATMAANPRFARALASFARTVVIDGGTFVGGTVLGIVATPLIAAWLVYEGARSLARRL